MPATRATREGGQVVGPTHALAPVRRRWEELARTMSTLLKSGGFTFYMVTFDCRESRHVHASRGDRRAAAKLWLDASVELVTAGRYNDRVIAQVERLVSENLTLLRSRWDAECRTAGENER
jgi:hypothetical protein